MASDRRRLLFGAAAIAASHPFSGALDAAHAATTPVLTSLRTTIKSWLYIAEDYAIENGHFERAGLDVKRLANGRGVLVDILLGGGCDLVLVSPSQVLRARSVNRPVKMLGVLVNRYASHVIVRKQILDKLNLTEASDPIAKGRAMKGLKIATPGPGSGADTLVRYLAEQSGLRPDSDLTIMPVRGGTSALLAAFKQGVADGFCFSSPTSDIAVLRFGGAYLFQMCTNPPPQLANYPYMVVAAREDLIETKRGALQAYCAGLTAAKAEMNSEPGKYKAWAKAFLDGLDDAAFDAAFVSDAQIAAAPLPMSHRMFDLSRDFAQAESARLSVPADFGKLTFDQCVDHSLLQERSK